MRTRQLLGILALGAAATSATLVPAAGAQEPAEVAYAASSSGQALALSVFGEGLTAGLTDVGIDSALNASADGTGLANPISPAGVTTATVTGEGTDGSTDEVCEGEFAEIPGLSIALACSSSVATVTAGVPSVTATGRVGAITVNPVQPLLETPLSEVVTGVEDGVNQLVDGLRPVTSGIDENTGLGLENTLDDLFGALFSGADLVSINLGATSSTASTGDTTISTKCLASGGRIDVLDVPAVVDGVDPEPVLSIIIGDAGSAVDVNTADGTATPTVNPAIVTVVAPSLGINQPVGPGDSVEIPLPEPLGSSFIGVAAGSTGENEAGQTFATADAVKLDLLNGEAMMGGIELALASCTSLAGATITEAPTTTAPITVPPLPRTGGGAPNSVALVAALGLAGLGLTLLRRSSAPTA